MHTLNRTSRRQWLTAAIAGLIPAVLLWGLFQWLGFAPSGDKSVLIMDMHNQNAAFFSSLRGLFTGNHSLFFSFDKQMGTGYAGLFGFFLASPLNWLVLLFPTRQLPLALLLLTCLKVGLCGLSMGAYLQKSRELPSLPALVLSCGYALMSYTVVYGMSVMWLDTVALLPLTLWGVERMVQGKRPVWLFLCLLAQFWCNYYQSYMVGLFAILYLLFLLYTDRPALSPLKATGRLAGTAVIAFSLLAFFLLPVGMDLLSGKLRHPNSWHPSGWYYFPPQKMLKKLLPGSYSSITYYGLPNLFCGSVPLLLAVGGLFCRKIPLRKRIGIAALLLILAASFVLCPLDFVWHGLQFPNWFPARYSFLWAFVIMLGGAELLRHLPLDRWRQHRPAVYWVTWGVVLTLSLAELSYNTVACIKGLDAEFGYRSLSAYEAAYDETAGLVQRMQERDGDFYRVEKTYQWCQNDAMLFGYHGISHYSSNFHRDFNTFSKTMGMNQRYFWNSYLGSTPVTDALLGVRYVLSKTPLPAYTGVAGNETVTAYENPYALPVITVADAGLRDWAAPTGGDPFTAQESWLSAMCGHTAHVWQPANVTPAVTGNTYTYSVNVPSDGVLYAALYADSKTAYSSLYVNGSYLTRCLGSQSPRVIPLGRYTTGETVSVRLEKSAGATLSGAWFAVLGEETLRTETAALGAGSRSVTAGSRSLSTVLNIGEGQILSVSLPYSAGFTVRIDGQKAETFPIGGALLGVAAPAGVHTVELSYTAPGFWPGLALSLLTAIGLAVYGVFRKIRRPKKTARPAARTT